MKRVPWGGTISRPLQYDGRHLDDEQDESGEIQQELLGRQLDDEQDISCEIQ